MSRDITVSFADGSRHMYQGVPDSVTPEQVTARAGQDFAGKQVINIDGGRGGLLGTLKEIGTGIARGFEEGGLGGGSRPLVRGDPNRPGKLLRGYRDPDTGEVTWDQSERDPETGAVSIREAKPPQQPPKSWTSTLSEMAGGMLGGGPAGIGSTVAGAGRLAASRVGRAVGIGAGEAGMRPWPTALEAEMHRGSLAAAQARDAARAAPTGGLARLSGRLIGGGPVRQAVTREATQQAALSAEEIANNLSRSGSQALGPAAHARIASFLQGGGVQRVLAAARDPQQAQNIAPMIRELGNTGERRVAAEILRQMTQDAPNFLRNWREITPEARRVLFGQGVIGEHYERHMTELAANIERIEAAAAYNPSRAVREAMNQFSRRHPVASLGTLAGATFAGLTHIETIIGALLNPKVAAVLGIGGAVVGSANRAVALALTNPSTVWWLAKATARMAAAQKAREYDLSDLKGDLQ